MALGIGGCAPVTDEQIAGEASSESRAGQWEIATPTRESSFAPALEVQDGELLLSWLEPIEGDSGSRAHRFRVARRGPGGWSTPVTVAQGEDFFANWADIPRIAAVANRALVAHWLAKTDEETYAYSIFLARSDDGGESWRVLGRLNDDATPTEHGFVSYVAEGDAARVFWLDGRRMTDGGDMTLRTALVTRSVAAGELLDDRVCECCATDAAMTDGGPVVVYRDRSADEIRDIGSIRRLEDGWGPSVPVADDGWRIEGCPVNGPVVAASGRHLSVVWYTAGQDHPRVEAALSDDAGATYRTVGVVDSGRPLGRSDIVADGSGGFVISWLEGADVDAEIRLRRLRSTGDLSEPLVVARTSPSRASGFPQVQRIEESIFVAWVDIDGTDATRVRLLEIPLSAVG